MSERSGEDLDQRIHHHPPSLPELLKTKTQNMLKKRTFSWFTCYREHFGIYSNNLSQ